MEQENPSSPSNPSPLKSYRLTAAGIAAIIVILAVEVTVTSRKLSATWEEPSNILAGLEYLVMGDFGVSPEHPPLAKLVEALPLVNMRLDVPFVEEDAGRLNTAVQGRALISNNDAAAILFRARLANAAFALLLVMLLWEAGTRMFSPAVGWLAAALALFEPNLIAHASLATSDFGLACLFFAAVYAFWRAAERPNALRLICCGIVLGMAFATKHIGFFLIPTLILLAAVEVISKLRHAGRDAADVLVRAALYWFLRLAAIGALAVITLWGFYGFRYDARPEGLVLSPALSTTLIALGGHLSRPLVRLATEYALLPEAYLYGLTSVLGVHDHPRVAYLLGHLYPQSVWYYFPLSLLIKSTLGFMALLFLSLFVARPHAWSGQSHRRAIYLLLPPLLFLAASLTSGTNIGIRHVLPVYPFLILAAAAGAWELARRRREWLIAVAVLLGFHIVSSVLSLPNEIAYSNELMGGTSRTYRSLSDSNVDWGQGLIEAQAYLAKHNVKDCWFAYYGSADPGRYGIPCKPLPDPFLWWWGPPDVVPPESYHGVVLISATEMTAAEWGPAVLNPYTHFLNTRPSATIGGSILVFDGDVYLTAAAAQAHMTKGWDLHKAGQQDLAMQELNKARELAPDHPGPPSMIGAILAEGHRTEEARVQLTEALKLAQAANPEYYSIWLSMIKAQLNSLD